MLDKNAILKTYPWLHNSEPKNVIMGDDLDAALATLLYLKHNPNAKLVGFYVDYKTIFYDKNMDIKALADAIYIDLDIYHEKCRSLGHHILKHKAADNLKGFHNSCNICALENRSCENFTQKYPLGTVHFLMWLYDEKTPENDLAQALIWSADSTYINAQNYSENVKNWLNTMDFKTVFEAISTEKFEQKVSILQNKMLENGFQKGKFQSKSRYLSLSGFQLQAEFPKNTHKVFDFIKNTTDWQIPENQSDIDINNMNRIDFDRKSEAINEDFDLNEFLSNKKVFSYVFPFADKINYTIFKKIKNAIQ